MGLILAKLWSLFGNEGVLRYLGKSCISPEPLFLPEHKICLVGLDNAGKTTILYQFLMNEVVHTSPTIGSNVEEVMLYQYFFGAVANLIQQVVWNNIHFVMWDLGGQESLRTAWNTYYSNTEFIILVWLLATSKTINFIPSNLAIYL